MTTIKARATSCSELEQNLSEEIASFKRKRRSPFRICSRCHFSIPHDYRLDIELWGARLTITQAPPDGGLSPEQPRLLNGRTAFADPEFGAYLTMTVYERTKSGALDRATHDIAFLLGLLNFTLNLGNLSWTLFNGERQMSVKVFPGREVFLLNADGVADVDVWRYYTTYPTTAKKLSDGELRKLEQHVKIIERLNRLKKGDRAFYRSFFELYFDALSEVDADTVVMRLWKAAEHITMGQSAQHIANRLALTWSDKEAVSAVCYALGQRRNWIMHNTRPAPQIEELPALFRHFLENSAWKSLSPDVRGVEHWKAIMQMSDIEMDLDLAADAVSILKALR
ncbi:hypothetical protein [Phenylobacterium sp. J367]|uniref:hypothetical protein n=1 Tax=Phenylobacterium sp. J367 TaxID=2898435 RepID=UPI0021513323|nr:hypothetical protein [Phenylobacterium sp. J367]MCR5878812.1 hypothetical protein [Phenylobacterium sp. J367]